MTVMEGCLISSLISKSNLRLVCKESFVDVYLLYLPNYSSVLILIISIFIISTEDARASKKKVRRRPMCRGVMFSDQ